ncbi:MULTISPECIES: LytR/AlgR family response regulator transcription factor [Uliginosibacterium]|uniref:Response regulator transcription factor n=1 Tax=Uliginosibacterium aquaticum TaxID=2731212 RepID=A0ABX2IB95_9RHOO|nr:MULTISPECIES: LytTR family DNA-binding domain-containing protein [Uliginosibacterium]MDO6386128.1 LytTR family DNA-binding domain-containing protein [Uliginosibacterium sp. 31-12]NSL53689.1 response regulator transcription factor [Uliginosibacterium aquaticum]PLK49194.1 DNA-binding response regulator [Uliginosibacterium sp. TH139]
MEAAATLAVLIVDDEAPARERLRDLLGDIAADQPTRVAGMAGNGLEALRMLETTAVDVILVDIRMPAMDGIEFAQHASRLKNPPRLIFVTAYDEHAVQAFELNAIDYLLKPVRAERLSAALQKARQATPVSRENIDTIAEPRRHLTCSERGKIHLIPISDVLYLKAELKYVTSRTVAREFLLEESLVQLEQEFPDRFVRIHRNCLVSREAVVGFERSVGEDGGEGYWSVRLNGLAELLPISRRQWANVRAVLGD